MQTTTSCLSRWPLAYPLLGLLAGQALAYPIVGFYWPVVFVTQEWVLLVATTVLALLSLLAKSAAIGRGVLPFTVGFAGVLYVLAPSTSVIQGERTGMARVLATTSSGGNIGRLELQTKVDGHTFRATCVGSSGWGINLQKVSQGAIIALRASFNPLRPDANPFAYDNTLLRRGIRYRCKILQASVPFERNASLAHALKVEAEERLARDGYQAQTRALMMATTFGYESGLDHTVRQNFKDTGLMHVLVVSGFQVSGLYLLSLAAFRSIGVRGEWGTRLVQLLGCFLCFWYVWLLEFELASTRALIAIVVFYLRSVSERSSTWGDLLLTAAFVLSVLWPGVLFEPGPQLTFAALVGIAMAQSPLGGVGILRSLWITTVATFCTGVVSLLWFRQFSLIGFFANPVLAPLIGGVGCVLSAFCVFLSQVSPAISTQIAYPVNALLGAELALIQKLAEVPWAKLTVASQSEAVGAVAGLLGLPWIALKFMRRKAHASLVGSQLPCPPRAPRTSTGLVL